MVLPRIPLTSRFSARSTLLVCGTLVGISVLLLSSYLYHEQTLPALPTIHWWPTPDEPADSTGPHVVKYTDDSVFRRCPAVQERTSKVVGGLPGFYILENLWYRNRTFYLFGEDIPNQKRIMTGYLDLVVNTTETLPSTPDVCFLGNTMLQNEGAGDWFNGLQHYYHFIAEDVLGALKLYATVDPPLEPTRMIVPWDMAWRDIYGIHEFIVDGLLDEPSVDMMQWERLTDEDTWVYFERVAFIDRGSAHAYNPQSKKFNKMAVDIFEEPSRPDFFQPWRQRLLKHYSIPSERPACPKIAYIDRQSTGRHMSEGAHEAFIKMLREVEAEGYGQVDWLWMEGLEVKDQIREVADATVMIGIHGNGLSHQMWMDRDSLVIELFPQDTFLKDYQIVAAAMGHAYHGVSGDTALTEEDYQERPGKIRKGGVPNGTPVDVSMPLVKELLIEYLRPRSAGCKVASASGDGDIEGA